ncbi:alpha/beta hydrolase [Microbacterium sp.]|uniref:alpha/beta hydrolase n=1 Tax=Microbacterium sp. TaxID=51671 RepID=UPI002C67AF25|nr:alpha/beta hydrolase [Microbacterium sp.]HWL77676.1 alpha/beta hydrolase [Microbacterium sp.]
MTLDDATAELVRGLAGLDEAPTWTIGAAEARRRRRPPRVATERDAVHRVENTDVPTAGGRTIPVRSFRPTQTPPGAILYFPGGGWVLGNNDGNDVLARRLAQATGLTIHLVEYSKAPEHPFPAAVEDAAGALSWAARQATGGPLHIAGDSAGANLATVTAIAACEAGPPLASQILLYPPTDADFGRDSYRDPVTTTTILPAELMAWFWEQYVPEPTARADPRAAPLRAPALAGLPPTLLITAEHDVLRDEDELYAQRLADAGVEITHRRFAGQMHGFLSFIDILPAAQAAVDAIGQWTRTTTRRDDT